MSVGFIPIARSRIVTSLKLPALVSFVAIFFARIFAQTVESRITAILKEMTMDEKILQLHQEGGYNTADNTQLGIPGFIMADGPHGVRNGAATSFPVAIGMAATQWQKFYLASTIPAEKLPVTMPINDGQLPPWNDDLNDDYGCGYRWFDGTGSLNLKKRDRELSASRCNKKLAIYHGHT